MDGRREYFGDGSMRQISPLSPAIHLGARQVLVIGVGQPERAGLGAGAAGVPGLGALREGGGSLASYLLFEPSFVQALVALGERDAYASKDRLLAFLMAGAA